MIRAMLLLIAVALAADVVLVAPDGAPWAGEKTTLAVAVAEAGAPVRGADVRVEATRGRVLGATIEREPGQYVFSYQAPPAGADADELRITAAGGPPVRWPLTVRPSPPGRLGNAADVATVVGTPRIELRFPSAEAPDARHVVVRLSEGKVIEVRREAEAIMVAVEPGAAREARVIGAAVLDTRRPGALPATGVVRLRARHTGAVTAEPGSKVAIRAGRRNYGPFVADKAGTANVSFESEPGETSYEIAVSDDLGNTQKLQSPLQALARPVVTAVDARTERGATVFIAAWAASGAAWSGAAPACKFGVGDRESTVAVAHGVFRTDTTLDAAIFEMRGDCVLGETAVPVRIPVESGDPARIELRVYPEALDADFPIAEAQVTLVDARGDRLPAVGAELTADRGEIDATLTGGVLRGEYRGGAAVAAGSDRLRATWNLPAGEGDPWSLRVYATPQGESLEVRVRVFGRDHRPLAGALVAVRTGEGDVVLTADERGWSRALIPRPAGELWVVKAASGAAAGEAAVFRVSVAASPDPALPDLFVSAEVSIRAGRVRQLHLDATPRPLVTGTGEEAVVIVRLLDAAGNLVRDEPVSVSASAGTVGPAEVRADGTFAARYTPPPGIQARVVHLTAASSGSTVSTDLELVPRPVRGAISAQVGWIGNFGNVSAPIFGIAVEHRLPIPLVSARVGVSGYLLDQTVLDATSGREIIVHGEFFPIDAGVVLTQRGPHLSLGAGVSAVLVPYGISVDYGENRGLAGVGLAPPGVLVHGSAGYRFAASEAFIQAGYLLYTAAGGAVSFEGGLGGLSLGAGYRVLY